MKQMNMKNKFVWALGLSVVLTACNVNNDLDPITATPTVEVKAERGTADFSKYVAVGASFTAGFTDGALFKASQTHSFPNILAGKFKMTNGGAFTQPLMNDNIGGYLVGGNKAGEPRFFFNGKGPARLPAQPTTEITAIKAGPYSNMGVPGLKSYHLGAPNYGNVAMLAARRANPYFVRMASAPAATVIQDAAAQTPTFFTMSEIGGNDVLGYSLAGGTGKDQKGNINVPSYGPSDITDPNVFAGAFQGAVNALTAGGAKGVVTTVPYVTSLPYFTTVPFNPLNPSTNSALAAQLPTLNKVYGALNAVFNALNQPNRVVTFNASGANPVVIIDEKLPSLATQIRGALLANPQFPAFVQQFGLPAQAAPLVANLLANTYGKARPATKDDLIVLPASAIIGKVNTASVQRLVAQGLPQALAGQFSAEGITLPLEDKWVLTADEVGKVKAATDAYNTTIQATATAKNLAVVDLKAILQQASTSGIVFDDYTLTTRLVTGGLVSLDGVHLTARGYALMANKILEAIDKKYGSNFMKATNGLAKAGNYPTNYNPALR